MKKVLIAVMVLFGAAAAKADSTEKSVQLCVNGVCIGSGGLQPDYGYGPGHGVHPGHGPGYGNNPGYGYGSEFVRCESIKQRYRECYFDDFGVRTVRLIQRHSKAQCIPGQSFGFYRGFIWVDRGCRATFEIVRW